MPSLLLIEEFKFFPKVSFYTVRHEGKNESETDRFIGRFWDATRPDFEPGYANALSQLMIWVDEIGSRGLRICSLRFENEAYALPPDRIYEKKLRHLTSSLPPLRLYCIPVMPDIVILCGGGIKSSQTAQASSDLKPHFQLATRIGQAITREMAGGDLKSRNGRLEGELEIWM